MKQKSCPAHAFHLPPVLAQAGGLRRRHALAALAAPWLGGTSARAAEHEIVIGQVAPLSGVLAETGREMVLGGKLYFDHVNANGGLRGKRIRHLVRDDGYEADKTVALTRELLDTERAVALFGFAGTANISRLLKDRILADANVALVAPYTGGEALRTPFNPNIFHIRAGYLDETRAMVSHFLGGGMKRIAVMHQDDAFGQAGLAGVEAALKTHGLQPVAVGTYTRNTEDVAQAVKVIAAAEPNAIIMVAVTRPSAAFVKQYRAVGKPVPMFNISVVNAVELARLAGSGMARGTGITQVVPSPFATALPVVREYQELLGRYAPPGTRPSYTSFEEFLGAKVLVEGLRRAKALTRDGVMRALENLSIDLGGFAVTFSPTSRVGSHMVQLTVISHDGKLLH